MCLCNVFTMCYLINCGDGVSVGLLFFLFVLCESFCTELLCIRDRDREQEHEAK